MNDPIPYSPGMTLMPGQSTVVSIQVPEGIAEHMQPGGRFIEVPPPEKAPVQSRAKELGLPDGLRVDSQRSGGQWRCCNCHTMQPGAAEMVWVPDGVCADDPIWSVTESARRGAFNGHSSGWCVSCAQRLGVGPAKAIARTLGGDDPLPLILVMVGGALAVMFLSTLFR